ncbi:hypothetical protein [Rhizobium mongolense]|uniref:Methyl-accepting chemotaxis protein n=1 Tax=Rhizobium mongolense TaxID=57676 RepID=A0A7W6RU77_9HYPH|nr:hypothetical protein [Rhizobium mongolense]MBB4278176.1 hypothetical protein [Rhizobium mongolense]
MPRFVVPLVVLIAGVGEQSTGIQNVSRAVRGVELVTQQNAAMVEENNASIHACASASTCFRTRSSGSRRVSRRERRLGTRAGRMIRSPPAELEPALDRPWFLFLQGAGNGWMQPHGFAI